MLYNQIPNLKSWLILCYLCNLFQMCVFVCMYVGAAHTRVCMYVDAGGVDIGCLHVPY